MSTPKKTSAAVLRVEAAVRRWFGDNADSRHYARVIRDECEAEIQPPIEALDLALDMVDGDGAPPDWDVLRRARDHARGAR